MNPTNGKGSKPRPITDSDAYSKNWDRIFTKSLEEYPDNPLEGGMKEAYERQKEREKSKKIVTP